MITIMEKLIFKLTNICVNTLMFIVNILLINIFYVRYFQLYKHRY